MPKKKINQNIRNVNKNLIKERDLERNIKVEISKELNKK